MGPNTPQKKGPTDWAQPGRSRQIRHQYPLGDGWPRHALGGRDHRRQRQRRAAGGGCARRDGDPAAGVRTPTSIAGYSRFALGPRRRGVRQRTHTPTRGGERISHACATPRTDETSRHRSDSQCGGAGPRFPFPVWSYRTPPGPHRPTLPRMGPVGSLHDLHSCRFFPVALSPGPWRTSRGPAPVSFVLPASSSRRPDACCPRPAGRTGSFASSRPRRRRPGSSRRRCAASR